MRKAVALIILLLVSGGVGRGRDIRTILVFPFENRSARADLNWISESFAEVISSRLSVPGHYVLDRDERNAAYAQLDLPVGVPLLLASKYKVAETLGIDWAVIGSFNVEGRRLSARAQLLDMRQKRLAPELEVNGELAELVDLETRLAWRLLATHDPSFTTGKEEDFGRRFQEVRLDAFENYIRAILATDDESRVRFLREADRLNPVDHQAAFELGRYYFGRKDYVNSALWLQKIGPADQNYLEALFLLGVDDFFVGKEAEAEKAFASLAQRTPLSEVWNNLGAMEARRGRYAEALAHFERAYQGDPDDFDFCFNLGLCLWHLKRYDEAAKHLEEAVRENGDDSEARALLAAALGKVGNLDAQRRQLQWLAEHEGGSVADVTQDMSPQARVKKNYEGRGFQLLSLALSNALEESLQRESAARHGEVHLARGKAFLADSRLAEAERELDEAVSLIPRSSDTHLALAEVYETEGRHLEAVTELNTSLRLTESVAAHLWLARAYLSLEQPEAARVESQAALRLDPGNRYAIEVVEQVRRRDSAQGKTLER